MSPMTGVIFLLSVTFAGVSPWTIDLPEARKFFFEKAEEHRHTKEVIKDDSESEIYDNIVPNSPHNKDEVGHESAQDNDVYGGKYAEDYEYLSYMEKKVHGIVHNGSVYLEGLRRSLEDYGQLLLDCKRLNFTGPQSSNGPWLPENIPQQPGPFNNQPGSFNNQPGSFNNQPGSNGNQPGSFSNQPGSFSNLNGSSNNQGPFNGSLPLNETTVSYENCARATRSSEHVRRLAELSLWATRELQDRAYAEKYDKKSQDEEEEEAELLVRLAFFLDRLAFLTGFEPQHEEYITEKPERPSTTTSAPFSVMGTISDDVKTLIMNCLSSNSSELTATDRCKYPLDHPDFIKNLFNITDTSTSVQPMSTPRPSLPLYMETLRNPQIPVTQRKKREVSSLKEEQKHANKDFNTNSRDKRGFLMNALFGQRLAHKILDGVQEEIESEHFEDIHHYRRRLFEKLAVLRNSHRKLVEFIATIRHRHQLEKAFEEREGERGQYREERTVKQRQKRQTEKPIVEFMKYYAKHKVWANANQENPGEFDVANQLSNVKVVTEDTTANADVVRIQKRSIDSKKYQHLKSPENPFQDLSNYVKHKKGVNYITDENQIQKLRQFLDKIQNSQSPTAKLYAQKVLKRQRRSNKYGRKFLPGESENPSQDISYYTKNKEGTEKQINLVQAAQVRQSLERIFQNPNIAVVQRYGFNFNPLIPYPLGYGLFLSFYADL